MKLFCWLFYLAGAACFAACQTPVQPYTTLSGLRYADFDTVIDGVENELFVLTNPAGMEVCVTNYGARVVSIMVPDRTGTMRDVVLGFDSIADYLNYPNNFGATIGRYANRIDKGRFELDGQTIQLPVNDNGNTLHGGPNGWYTRMFRGEQTDSSSVTLHLVSLDGDENFPGTVKASVTYTVTPDNALQITYQATTDKKTVINMTNHSYFNLSGDPSRPATDHWLYVDADRFTPIDSLAIPNGEPMDVAGTPMDFTTAKPIDSALVRTDYEAIRNGIGVDHNYLLNTPGDMETVAASLLSPTSGIQLEVFTDEPGLQVYSGNYLDGTQTGKKGIAYAYRTAVCLESQHFPDSPNHPNWPSVILEPGQTYQSHCIYRFSVQP